ncbi:glycosyltransferase [Cryobacterium sp. PH31-O1]|uniref:glycosyltransferase n=1 Tax=Cryobacterium sp. PH31-O1 TaxID=3046306 RepID=UPI0024BBC04A|nr:glycosyltransferase [Cryobacterium sp. PH31-O1]MDJ0338360.1 glycosyltransferase [Cryobacterium sp. PH31-O1]
MNVAISILMPSYNPGQYGIQAVESVLQQLGPADEIVIQDGNSTDGWLADVMKLDDSRVKIVSEPDEGQADALNKALLRASNDWVGWLNADDVYFDGALNSIRSAADSDAGMNALYGNFSVIDAEGSVIYRKNVPEISLKTLALKGCGVFSGSFFVRRCDLNRAGGFSKEYQYCMDYELYLRLWSMESFRGTRMTCQIGALRIHPGTKTSSAPWSFFWEARKARRSLIGDRWLLLASGGETFRHALTAGTHRLRQTKMYRDTRNRFSNV